MTDAGLTGLSAPTRMRGAASRTKGAAASATASAGMPAFFNASLTGSGMLSMVWAAAGTTAHKANDKQMPAKPFMLSTGPQARYDKWVSKPAGERAC